MLHNPHWSSAETRRSLSRFISPASYQRPLIPDPGLAYSYSCPPRGLLFALVTLFRVPCRSPSAVLAQYPPLDIYTLTNLFPLWLCLVQRLTYASLALVLLVCVPGRLSLSVFPTQQQCRQSQHTLSNSIATHYISPTAFHLSCVPSFGVSTLTLSLSLSFCLYSPTPLLCHFCFFCI